MVVDLTKPRRIAAFDGEIPDREWANFDKAIKLWRSHGLDCAIYVSPALGNFNGYVRLPDNAPDRRIAEAHAVMESERRRADPVLQSIWRDREVNDGYDALDDIEVHGGLTYGPDEEGWVGFDTGHAGDMWLDEIVEQYVRPRSEEAWAKYRHLQHLMGDVGFGMVSRQIAKKHGLPWDIDWTMERLEAEVENLALQIYERVKAAGVKLPNGA